MLKLFSPAKVNLFFRVLFSRKDGFHEIFSLFQALNFGDIVSLELVENCPVKDSFAISANAGYIRAENIQQLLEHPQKNLVLQAVELFRKKTGRDFSVNIHLLKQIPFQSGLGGGSSNAAAVLKGLNSLLKNPLQQKELLELAASLGSDVAFFFSSGTAYCYGRGEIFQDVELLPSKKELYLAFPDFGSDTKEVFQTWDSLYMQEDRKSRFKVPPKNSIRKKPISFDGSRLFNDLEEAAFKTTPALQAFKQQLLGMGFEKVSLTGSGSAFICVGPPKSKRDGKLNLFKVGFLKQENSFPARR